MVLAMAASEPNETTPSSQRDALIEALTTIEHDASELAGWAAKVLRALRSGDDEEAAELGGYVDAILDYTKYVEAVEEWAEEHQGSDD